MNLNSSKQVVGSVARWYEPFLNTFVVVASLYVFTSTFFPYYFTDTQIVLAVVAVNSVLLFILEVIKNKVWQFVPPHQTLVEVFKNSLVKFSGVLLGTLLMLFFYWLIPEYGQAKYLEPINEAIPYIVMYFLPVCLLVIFITEYLLGNKKDGTYNLGLLLTLQLEKINWQTFKSGLLEWFVKLFFLTLNFTTAVALVDTARLPGTLFNSVDFVSFVLNLVSYIFLVILLAILPGYLFSSRLINTEFKNVSSKWFDWTVTLVCYQPFINPVIGNIFKYYPIGSPDSGPVWADITGGYLVSGIPVLLFLIGSMIIVFELVHLWAEAILGVRSSNLSNRGIVTNGPFAFTKHPVYISKAFGWFCITLPFLNSETFLESFRLGVLFICVILIYIGRSFAEERLLATDPTYVQYAKKIDKDGIFAFVGKIFPFMTFSWRYDYWKKRNYV